MVNKTWYPTEYHVRHLKCHIHNNYLNETFYRAKSSSIFLDKASPRKSCAIIFPSLSIIYIRGIPVTRKRWAIGQSNLFNVETWCQFNSFFSMAFTHGSFFESSETPRISNP